MGSGRGPREARVVIVGCGAAGVTAAIGLARRGISVVVVEGAPHPGAENWSGAVYFCENLVRPEILGEQGLLETPLERRVVRRGLLCTDGRVAPGLMVDSHAAFTHCYTVLRPLFDHDLAAKARLFGARILEATTVTALIRDGDWVRGVMTDRGPLLADVVFLAEGDASNLLGREGLEAWDPTSHEPRQPEFLQGIKEVLHLEPELIHERFGLQAGEGLALEILLRNGLQEGRSLPLNAAAFLYTNRESLSLGLVAPLKNLTAFHGDHNRLMEWLKGLPALRPLLEGAQPLSFGAKLIRGGGMRQWPRLVLPGLAVGGAASGLGVDFPCPNFTGPATFMGFAFSEAVAEILEGEGSFDQAALEATYLQPVLKSVYMQDLRQLRDWPVFVAESREFFGRQVDLLAGTAHILTGTKGLLRRHLLAARHLFEILPPRKLRAFVTEQRRGLKALGFLAGTLKDLHLLIFWWTFNLLRGFFPRRTRTGARLLPVLFHDGSTPRRKLPLSLRCLRWRLAPGLAEALHQLYRNDGLPLARKLRLSRQALLTRLSLLDLVFWPLLLLLAYLLGGLQAGLFRLWVVLLKPSLARIQSSPFFCLRQEARRLSDWSLVREVQSEDQKLALISFESDERTHIHFHAASDKAGLPLNAAVPAFHICPARVYREEVDQSLSTAVAVLHENCVRCESCWRGDPEHVDWGRTRGHRLVFQAYSSADPWLHESQTAATLAELKAGLPAAFAAPAGGFKREPVLAGMETPAARSLRRACALARDFLRCHQQAPAVLSGADQSLLAELATALMEEVRGLASTLVAPAAKLPPLKDRLEALNSWAALAQSHQKARRYFHLEGDLELLLIWHLPGLGPLPPLPASPDEGEERRQMEVRALMEERLSREMVAASEEGLEPDEESLKLLLELAKSLAAPDASPALVVPAGSPKRDLLLEELARQSPSLALLLARHLAALDLLYWPKLTEEQPGALGEVRQELARGDLLLGLVEEGVERALDGTLSGETEAALVGGAQGLVVVTREGCGLVGPEDPGVVRQIVGAIGLRGAGPGWLKLRQTKPRAFFQAPRLKAVAATRSAWDLVAVARGMASYLQERALDHAEARVQFPGLFRDLRGRDGIAKFGAVQAMLAGIATGVEVLQGLRGGLGHGRTAAALALDLLGCAPRSVAYLAGQVLGGMAYSEEDPVSRFYRDASALTRFPRPLTESLTSLGQRYLLGLKRGAPLSPGLDLKVADQLSLPEAFALVTRRTEPVRERLGELSRSLIEASPASQQALLLDLGRLAVLVMGVRILALRAQEKLECGQADGVSLLALEWLASRVARRAALLSRRAPEAEEVSALGLLLLHAAPEEGEAGAAGATYEDFLTAPDPFVSGDLFLKTGTSKRLACTPELLEADPLLSRQDAQAAALFKSRFQEQDLEGRPYTRLVEDGHHIPERDLRFLLERGDFRRIIPAEFLGLGNLKAAYYLECSRMMRHGDPAQAIIVMGSSSIGTTPILIGLLKDLPEARRSWNRLLEHPSRVAEVRLELSEILALCETPEVMQAGPRMKALEAAIRRHLSTGKAGRLLFQDFLAAFLDAGRAGRRRDLPAFVQGLQASLEALQGWQERLCRERDSLTRREAAHRFFLKLIATGRISAFALTEPSAGSDTARIRTRAERVSVPVAKDPRGFYRFTPPGSREERHLFPYDAFEWQERRLFFIRGDRVRVPVELQDFAYEKPPEEARFRYVVLDGERLDIHDIGQVEHREEGSFYNFFQVNGAKMWITNGSVAGVMILYARTEAGPTALMLDAHAEGLVVGKDEHKMGQRGSATNELSLSDVRIPVDQIIGLEGRGQENALETLNVGRTGLAVSSVGLMHEIVQEVRDGLSGKTVVPWQQHELGRMALDLVASESLAWHVAGRSDHQDTTGLRMESAMAKMASSEALLRLLQRAERILDPSFALETHELEKRRRDARVLTIYEGTNEVQRFLLLKDLCGGLDLGRVLEEEEPAGATPPLREASDLLRRSREQVLLAISRMRQELGPRAWQVVAFQSRFFHLVEAALQVTQLSAALHRARLARRLLDPERGRHRLAYLEGAVQLLARDLARLDFNRLADLEREGRRIAAGRDPLAAALADQALLRRKEAPQAAPRDLPRPLIRETLQVALVLFPEPLLAPQPRLRGGRLGEVKSRLSAFDRAALGLLGALKRQGPVEVTVVALGGLLAVPVLREVLALGADRAWLINTSGRPLLAPEAAAEVAQVLRTREELEGQPFHLLVGHEEHGELLLPLCRTLGIDAIPAVTACAAFEKDEDLRFRVRTAALREPLDLAPGQLLMVTGTLQEAACSFDLEGWRQSFAKTLTVMDWVPEKTFELRLDPLVEETAAPAGVHELTLDEVAGRFSRETGLVGAAGLPAAYQGELSVTSRLDFLEGLNGLAVVEAGAAGKGGAGLGAAIRAARAAALPGPALGVMVVVPKVSGEILRQAAGQVLLAARGSRVGLCMFAGWETFSPSRRGQVLENLLEGYEGPVVFAWSLRSAGLLAGEGRSLGLAVPAPLLHGVDRISCLDGRLACSGPCFGGRIRFSLICQKERLPGHLITAGEVRVELPEKLGARLVEPAVMLLDDLRLPGRQDPLSKALQRARRVLKLASLAEAEFIIDVGYGVGSRDGIEEVVEPLRERLLDLGVQNIQVGATRKVTQDLGLLPPEQQIGQTGVSVAPKVLLALGVSGAPQHMDYIGERAVVFAFNKDPLAPIMIWNKSRTRPVVLPVVGDLFLEVPRFLEALARTLQAQEGRLSTRPGSPKLPHARF